MIEKQVDLKTVDGIVDCDLFYPDENGQWPGIIMYTDIGGRRPVFVEMGKRLAAEGFVVLVPNPFYRVSRAPVYQDFKFGSEATTARMAEVRATRAEGRPTLPSTMGLEKQTNPFLRPHAQEIRRVLGLEAASDVEIFAETRRRKDNF